MNNNINIMALSGSFWEKFVEFFSPKLGQYDNFEINQTSFVAIQYVIIGIFFGIILASLSALYNKRVLGGFIRALIKRGATSPEAAMTLSELGFSKNPFVKYSLSRGYTLKRSVCRIDTEEAAEGAAAKSDRDGLDGARFYIPEEKKYAMENKFEAKGTNWLTFALTVIISLVLVGATVLFLPEILRFADNLINLISGK